MKLSCSLCPARAGHTLTLWRSWRSLRRPGPGHGCLRYGFILDGTVEFRGLNISRKFCACFPQGEMDCVFQTEVEMGSEP